jgi:rubredoxin
MQTVRPSIPAFGCPKCPTGLVRFVSIDNEATLYQCDVCKTVLSEEEVEEAHRALENQK